MAVFFLASCAGTYAVFTKYVLPMQQQLAEQEKVEAAISKKIRELEVEFERTVPDVVIRALQDEKQPWVNASKARTVFFKLEEVSDIEIPENAIPRFWYEDKYPELEDSLYEAAGARGILLTSVDFDVKTPNFFGSGTNPTREEILKEVNKYNYGIQMTKFIFGANPSTVDSVNIWPKRSAYNGRSGTVYYRTTGYRITVMWDDLLRFLERLARSDYYVTVDAIKVTNKTLRDSRNPDPMSVELILTEAQFEPHTGAIAGLGADGADGSSGLFNMAFGGDNAAAEAEEESSGIMGFLKKLNPFD
ncbi:MAG: hypothetical protein VCD00_00110 [Candidatus Hydrogenedentota bacterium]